VTALGREELISDPRFLETFHRLKNSKEIQSELAPTFATRTTADWLAVLAEHDAVFAPVNTPETIINDPQVVAAGLVIEAEHPHSGTYRTTAHPARFGATPAQLRLHPPMLGEHTDGVLTEAGYTQIQISELRDAGAVR
jgi:crotonobetainyl-CoA:carnitine CoA-transferase CaiB-like acyl-CoA transferase